MTTFNMFFIALALGLAVLLFLIGHEVDLSGPQALPWLS